VAEATAEPEPTTAPEAPADPSCSSTVAATPSAPEDPDMTWEDKEDKDKDKDKKLDAEKAQPQSTKSAVDKKYEYKDGKLRSLSHPSTSPLSPPSLPPSLPYLKPLVPNGTAPTSQHVAPVSLGFVYVKERAWLSACFYLLICYRSAVREGGVITAT